MAGRTPTHGHLTTRRGFVAATGFGVVSLYLLWAGYGAAPIGFGGKEEEPATGTGGGHPAEPTGGGHGGGDHGAGGSGMSADEFKRLVQAFVEANKLPDGSVKPGAGSAAAPPVGMQDHAMHGAAMPDHALQAPATPSAPREALTERREAPPAPGDAPIDVYLMAYQWGYAPAVLRLETGVRYRFRMMAVDTAHGASIQLGGGGRMVRLRPNALVEQELAFSRPGEYLLYCTVYCGLAHDRMQGKIVVADAKEGS
ncbi:MAG TPA: hypothetical protein VLD36_05520 [Burkholderiales bacterium]|nr:hypothetical protein [Burkholderiales bacterium]